MKAEVEEMFARQALVMWFRGENTMLRPNMGVFTQPISCVGLPVFAAPAFGGGMPIGVQLIAAPGARIYACARLTR